MQLDRGDSQKITVASDANDTWTQTVVIITIVVAILIVVGVITTFWVIMLSLRPVQCGPVGSNNIAPI